MFLPMGGFMFVMTAPFGSSETHKLTWLQSCQPMVLSETRGLRLCWVMRGGIGSRWRLGAEAHKSPNFWLDTLPRPERLKKKPDCHRQGMIPKRWNGLSFRDAQAACGFNCLASKCAPFFHRIRVIAAIFRAKVRRAIAGFIPLVSKPW